MAKLILGCILQLVLFIICMHLVVSAEYVPVFVWESSSDSKSVQTIPALTKINSNEFKSFINEKLRQKNALVVFIEENLSVEDFSWQDSLGRGSFPKLQAVAANTDAVTYFPNVRSPLHILDTIDKIWQHSSLLPEGLTPDAKFSNDSLLYINLIDATEYEDRPHLLKKHDKFITETYENLAKLHDHVTAVYTARYSSWSDDTMEKSKLRLKREANDEEVVPSGVLYNADNKIYLYASSTPILILDQINITLGDASSVEVINSTDSLETALISQMKIEFEKATLTFNFYETNPGYWGLVDVFVVDLDNPTKEITLSANGIEAPLGFSYHCSQTVQFITANTTGGNSANTSLTFDGDFQVQPSLREVGENAKPKFDDAYDCVYFFTVPILSGFFVTILFAWIMMFGICMIMDIKTMDRFDDPKGKTITVSAVE